jgi:predicted nucleic acid-binding protein
MTPDVNVLVAASRTDHPYHTVALTWLEQAVAASGAGAAFTLMPMVLASFLRLVTSPKIFQRPTPIEDAVVFVDDRDFKKMLSRGHFTLLVPK